MGLKGRAAKLPTAPARLRTATLPDQARTPAKPSDPQVPTLGIAAVSRAAFTYADGTHQEIDHKVAAMRSAGRTAQLVAYIDGLLKLTIRMQMGTILNLRSTGNADAPSVPDFHQLLRSEPDHFDRWTSALRLHVERQDLTEATSLAPEIISTLPSVISQA